MNTKSHTQYYMHMAANKNEKPIKRYVNKGAWTTEEDQKLAEYIEIHGAKRWKAVAVKAGLNRCEKSCRLRWLNYLRPNIKRGKFTDQEEDLIIRLHRLLGNRWSLIAGRLPGRTDNDIKNYWNSHLCKKIKHERTSSSSVTQEIGSQISIEHADISKERSYSKGSEGDSMDNSFNVNEFFNFSNEGSSNLEWISKFLELDDDLVGISENYSVPFLGEVDKFNVFYS
ncbi:hypothetical protein IFM89_030526 [Coptis chinensis]|uniref:Uncharacterized protein n=1 Tax=Coptis chinensis TaxID=261450 RepID=A0A835HSX5_9MAGN|nr:hypothetical protein IFM89_030526 [Coptis chinensis]